MENKGFITNQAALRIGAIITLRSLHICDFTVC